MNEIDLRSFFRWFDLAEFYLISERIESKVLCLISYRDKFIKGDMFRWAIDSLINTINPKGVSPKNSMAL